MTSLCSFIEWKSGLYIVLVELCFDVFTYLESLFSYCQMTFLPCTVDGVKSEVTERHKLYSDPMSKLRGLMISRMAKPEEVLIVEDENGNIVRETMKDNDVLVQYKVPTVPYGLSLVTLHKIY